MQSMDATRRELPARSSWQSDLVARSKAVIPAGTTNSIVPPDDLEFIVERGDGPYLYDVDGRRFLDFLLGGGPLILGHAPPRLVAAVAEAAPKGTHHFGLHRRTVELAERLVRYVPCAEMVRFTSSGSEATFHALRLARAVTGRSGIIKFDGAYHGHHDLAVWSFERTKSSPPLPTPESAGVQPGVADDVCVLPFNDAEGVRRTLRENPRRFAAVICEPLQRVLSPEPGFLETLREECTCAGTVLIFDEVVTGFRLHAGGAQAKYGVVPDLATFGKALSGGLPLSAVTGRRDLMAHFDPRSAPDQHSFHCGTFNGYLLAVECAHVTLDILVEEGGIERLLRLGQIAREAVEKACVDAGVPVHVCGEGPLFHPYFTESKVRSNADVAACDWELSNAFHRKLYQAGIYKTFTKGYVGLAHTEAHLRELGTVASWALRTLKSGASVRA
jgi:glutamate-1-semialdehyde 2,1-aminomutase